jgi:hypothetical protein
MVVPNAPLLAPRWNRMARPRIRTVLGKVLPNYSSLSLDVNGN